MSWIKSNRFLRLVEEGATVLDMLNRQLNRCLPSEPGRVNSGRFVAWKQTDGVKVLYACEIQIDVLEKDLPSAEDQVPIVVLRAIAEELEQTAVKLRKGADAATLARENAS